MIQACRHDYLFHGIPGLFNVRTGIYMGYLVKLAEEAYQPALK
jgi:hypothetical protein